LGGSLVPMTRRDVAINHPSLLRTEVFWPSNDQVIKEVDLHDQRAGLEKGGVWGSFCLQRPYVGGISRAKPLAS
jgi:hypothetical protein